jgi:hypothetical protein
LYRFSLLRTIHHIHNAIAANAVSILDRTMDNIPQIGPSRSHILDLSSHIILLLLQPPGTTSTMPQGYSTRAGTKGPRSVEKKLAKQPVKPIKEKSQLAKAAALEKRKAAQVSHAERKATFEANRPLRWIRRKHEPTDFPPDSGTKATRERTSRNMHSDAKLMKADGHGRRHEGLPGDDGWATTKGKGKGDFEYPEGEGAWEPGSVFEHGGILQRG